MFEVEGPNGDGAQAGALADRRRGPRGPARARARPARARGDAPDRLGLGPLRGRGRRRRHGPGLVARARAPLDAASCRRSTSSIPGYWTWFIPLHDGITSVGVTGPTGFDERAAAHAGGLPALSRRARRDGAPAALRQAARPGQLRADRLLDRALLRARPLGTHRRGRDLRRSAVQPRAPTSSRTRTTSSPSSSRATSPARARPSSRSAAISTTGSWRSARKRRCSSTATTTRPSAASSWQAEVGLRHRQLLQPLGVAVHARRAPRPALASPPAADGAADPVGARQLQRAVPRVADSLRKRGEFYRANQGKFTPGLDHLDFLQRVGLPRPRREVLEKTEDIFNDVRRRALQLLGPDTALDPEEKLSLWRCSPPSPLAERRGPGAARL